MGKYGTIGEIDELRNTLHGYINESKAHIHTSAAVSNRSYRYVRYARMTISMTTIAVLAPASRRTISNGNSKCIQISLIPIPNVKSKLQGCIQNVLRNSEIPYVSDL